MARDEHDEAPLVQKGANVPRGVRIPVNRPWAQEQGPDGEQRYAAAIAAIVRGGPSEGDELLKRIRSEMQAANLNVSDDGIDRLAEQLQRAEDGHVSVIASDGNILYGPEEGNAHFDEPDVHGTEDPADPDRPFYT